MLSETLTGLHVKYPLFLPHFNAALIFSRFSKNLHIPNLTHIQWKPKRSMRTDGRTHDEANDHFSQFCECA